MPTNKQAQIRYNALDKCFCNFQKRFYIDDLINACNEALYNATGKQEGVKRRQVYEDIKFIESADGFNAEIERIQDGKQKYYRYKKKGFSIHKKPIADYDIKQIKTALSLLYKVKGFPNFEWIHETITRLDSGINSNETESAIIEFQQNDFIDGLKFMSEIYNSIINQQTLKISYKSYKSRKKDFFDFHPYFLKQYNSRWYLFGLNEKYKRISNLALDRILEIKSSKKEFRKNEDVDFSEYFYDVVGVTIMSDEPVENVVLEIHQDLLPYIESKPLHGSQIVNKKKGMWTKLTLNVKLNYELESIILSHGEKIRVLEPERLRTNLKNRISQMMNNFNV